MIWYVCLCRWWLLCSCELNPWYVGGSRWWLICCVPWSVLLLTSKMVGVEPTTPAPPQFSRRRRPVNSTFIKKKSNQTFPESSDEFKKVQKYFPKWGRGIPIWDGQCFDVRWWCETLYLCKLRSFWARWLFGRLLQDKSCTISSLELQPSVILIFKVILCTRLAWH